MVKIVCRRCQFRNDQYNLHCGNCGASFAPESNGQRAVVVRNIWIGVLAGALLLVAAVLVVQRGGSVPATDPSAAGSAVNSGAPPAGGAAAPVRPTEIPMPNASSGPETITSDSSDPGCPPEEVALFLENSESLEKEFTDGSEVAHDTSRLLLPTVVTDLQSVRRSYANLGGPACTRRAHSAVEKAMTSRIEAFLIFMRNSPAGDATKQMDRAMTDWEDGQRELSNLRR